MNYPADSQNQIEVSVQTAAPIYLMGIHVSRIPFYRDYIFLIL